MSSGRLVVGAATMPPVARCVSPLSTRRDRWTRSASGSSARGASRVDSSSQPRHVRTVASSTSSARGAEGAMPHAGYQVRHHWADSPATSSVVPS